jgi:hypothetical protein
VTQKSKTRVYVAIIIVALAALFVDRFLLGGKSLPATAVAKESAAHGVKSKSDATPDGLSIPELPFPRNLPRAGDPALMRDLFAFVGASQDDRGAAGRAGRGAKSSADALSDAASFGSTHHLDAVLLGSGLEVAVINNVWVQKGQTLDGCTLERIEKTRAYLKCGEDQAVLDLATKFQNP